MRWVERFFMLWAVDAISLLVTATSEPGVTLAATETARLFAQATAAAFMSGIINLLNQLVIRLLTLPLGFFVTLILDAAMMPMLKQMMDQEGYVLSHVDRGLPSQTSACQAGIMFGENDDIPALASSLSQSILAGPSSCWLRRGGLSDWRHD